MVHQGRCQKGLYTYALTVVGCLLRSSPTGSATFSTAVPQRPLLMIFDRHKTHLGLEVKQIAMDANVLLLKLPSHTTNRLQPLDVSCFRPLKLAWDERLIVFQRANAFRCLKKRHFVYLLSEVWTNKLTVTTIQNGFRKTGVFLTAKLKKPAM